ncbi:hypothetical protein [Micromonospora sp. WMMD998]|uniref:hypothetical protein n=1 Tax=Micromonospora sp. WMMD998 TaxID=3016092 RepID=UPI00249C213B|nr:hypothetical protein [Micromonospora sp. WMMD998]WFE41912.1 hypothetical protein O7619_27090 [Micromonospora sp. WMMD998]
MTEKQGTNRRPIEDLTAGDHISDSQGVHEVVHVLGMQDGGQREITLTLRPVGPGKPWLMRHTEGSAVAIATQEEVREYADLGRRRALADALHTLADGIVEQRLPLPRYWIGFRAVLDSRADVDRWAAYLGVETKVGDTNRTPSASADRPVADGLTLDIHMQGPAEPEPEQEWLFTFGPDHGHDGRFVRITGTHDSARARMVEVFGTAWCDQYTWQSFDAAGLPSRLTELTGSEWLSDALTAEA